MEFLKWVYKEAYYVSTDIGGRHLQACVCEKPLRNHACVGSDDHFSVCSETARGNAVLPAL